MFLSINRSRGHEILNQLQAMRVFVNIAETNSFGLAATNLGMSKAMVTRYLEQLEAHLSTKLINRSTRSVSLTEEGEIYVKSCRHVFDEIEAMESAAIRGATEPAGTLRIVAGASFSPSSLTPMLKQYLLQYPNVRLALTLLHRSVDFVREGFDVGIVHTGLVSGTTLINRPLLSIRSIAVASPDYLNSRGTLAGPSDLLAHSILAHATGSQGGDWIFVSPAGQEERVNLTVAYSVNNTVMLRDAARAGMGIAVLPVNHVIEDLRKNTLVPVLEGYHLKGADKHVSMVYADRRRMSAKTRSFVDFAINWYQINANQFSY